MTKNILSKFYKKVSIITKNCVRFLFIDIIAVTLLLNFQVDTCDGLQVPTSFNFKNTISKINAFKFYFLKQAVPNAFSIYLKPQCALRNLYKTMKK